MAHLCYIGFRGFGENVPPFLLSLLTLSTQMLDTSVLTELCLLCLLLHLLFSPFFFCSFSFSTFFFYLVLLSSSFFFTFLGVFFLRSTFIDSRSNPVRPGHFQADLSVFIFTSAVILLSVDVELVHLHHLLLLSWQPSHPPDPRLILTFSREVYQLLWKRGLRFYS